jgi:hypothetical protein
VPWQFARHVDDDGSQMGGVLSQFHPSKCRHSSKKQLTTSVHLGRRDSHWPGALSRRTSAMAARNSRAPCFPPALTPHPRDPLALIDSCHSTKSS